MTTIQEQIATAVGAVLFNVSNFPEKAHTRLLGQDMKPLNDKITAAVMPLVKQVQAEVWDEGYKAGNVDGYFQTHEEKNPYIEKEVGA